jgi:ATP-dependent helicase/DNAse subunit B
MGGVTAEEMEDAVAPPLTDAELMHRGSSLLELQSGCPFRAFAELRLGATDANEPSVGIEPRIRGNLIEDVLDAFWQDARDLENLRGISANDRKMLIARAVDQALRKHLADNESAVEAAIREIERARLEELTSEWLDLEEKRAPFDQVRHQQKFEYTVAGVQLRGRIDRIDRSITHLGEVIIDYKAGAGARYKRNSWETPRPRLPQLPLYAAYLQSEGKTVVGVGFGILNTAKSRVEGLASTKDIFGNNQHRPKWAKSSVEEQITAWAQEIERLVKEHMDGAAQVDPKVPPSRSSSTCEHCHLHAMCRVAELTVIDGDEEVDGDE